MRSTILTAAGLGACLALGACTTTPANSQPNGSVSNDPAVNPYSSTYYSPGSGNAGQNGVNAVNTAPQISIDAFNKDLIVGDTTTLTVSDRNTLGRNAHVEWIATGGRIMTAEGGRLARISFDAPGNYTVTAMLNFGNIEVARDSVNITARPLR